MNLALRVSFKKSARYFALADRITPAVRIPRPHAVQHQLINPFEFAVRQDPEVFCELLMREAAVPVRFEQALYARWAFVQHYFHRGRERTEISGRRKKIP